MKIKADTYICCGKVFNNKKAFTNHTRWCFGIAKYKNNRGYAAIHSWVRNRKPKPVFCEHCGEIEPKDLANISGNNKRDVSDYIYLCRSCHKKMDFTEKTRKLFIYNASVRERNERGRFI